MSLRQNGHNYNDAFICEYCGLDIVETKGRRCEVDLTPGQLDEALAEYDEYWQDDNDEKKPKQEPNV